MAKKVHQLKEELDNTHTHTHSLQNRLSYSYIGSEFGTVSWFCLEWRKSDLGRS